MKRFFRDCHFRRERKKENIFFKLVLEELGEFNFYTGFTSCWQKSIKKSVYEPNKISLFSVEMP